MAEGERKLAAIMYTDMVGYTVLGQRNEALSLTLVNEQRKLIRPVLSRHRGREIKTIGDALLVEFPSAVDAVRCAYEIQRSAREFNLSLAADKRIHLRIGIHLGEVVEDQGDILGDAVNVASRIEKLAEDGGVSVTSHVHDHVQGKLDLQFASLGHQVLKGVGHPVEVFRVVMPWKGTDAAAALYFPPTRIAVLPFANMSPDPNDEYFADGMTEELIDRLSQLKGLEVISRTSVMSYKGEKKKASEIARELRVGSLVEGSLRKAGDKIRVTAQLINAGTEGHLWSSRYDRSLQDVFSVQADIAEQVTDALRVKLLPSEKLTIQKESTRNTEAYTLYLRAKQLGYEGLATSNREALLLLKRAVSMDPSFLMAYVELVYVYTRGSISAGYLATQKEAEAAATKALELGPESAEAHLAMANVHMNLDRFELARTETEKALEFNPNLSEGYAMLGRIHMNFGRLEEALSCYREAFDLDPMSYPKGSMLAWTFRMTGRVEDALREYALLEELQPQDPRLYVNIFLCYVQIGDLAQASRELTRAEKIDTEDHVVKTAQGMLYALTGRRSEAEATLESISTIPGRWEDWSRDFSELWIRTTLGDLDKAFTALMTLAESHAWPESIPIDPLLKPLRDDPRFAEFRRRVDLPH